MEFWIPPVAFDAGEEDIDDYRAVFEMEVHVSSNVRLGDIYIEPSQIGHSYFVEDDLCGHLKSPLQRQSREEGEIGETTPHLSDV